MVYCIICGQRIYQKAFLNCLSQCLSFLNIFFNRFCPVEKCGVTPHCLHRDLLTLILKKVISSSSNFFGFSYAFRSYSLYFESSESKAILKLTMILNLLSESCLC